MMMRAKCGIKSVCTAGNLEMKDLALFGDTVQNSVNGCLAYGREFAMNTFINFIRGWMVKSHERIHNRGFLDGVFQ